ncbi:PREDICTED: agamous-like MADS-box protein AGL62, partial [Tarenaya hassleriana]|uniref:agamous-like MADS-box protein AGL62 n=1 Tax=Tarenaya hassleriana TaxID=28532 RepID=UPI00053C1264
MGTKRKIAMAKRETKSQRSVTFSKRRLGLFKKAAELSAISGAQIAVLATPPSGNPNAVYSGPFGHSYTDAVVDAFLSGRIPTAHNFLPDKNLGSGFLSENCDDELGILIEKLISDLKNSPGSGFLSENCDDDLLILIEKLSDLKNNPGSRFLSENCDDPDELRIQIEKLSDLKDCVGIIQRKREEQIVSCGHNLDKDSNAKSA